ncbi:MAG TPA: ATP-binding protein [Steroidobacteraceae bacterium]|nr:ATP-binding protein [Steroidobacteraceae bacterium]
MPLISRISQEFRFARLWPWIEKTALRRFGFAAILAAVAAALHWAILPITQARVTFIFFVPAIVLVTTIAGRWPGVLVAMVGLVNSAIMKEPGTIMIPNSAEQVAMISSALVSILVILVGDYYRSISRRELSDLHDLHELSAALATLSKLPDQLKLILTTFARMHGATAGLVCTYQTRRDTLSVAASIGISPRALNLLDEQGGGCGLAFVERVRVEIADTETDARFAAFRDFAREEAVRSIHSTPLISRDGEILGALAVHFPAPRRPSEREIRIAGICARKAAVFIERARAEDLVSERDRRFESVLEVSAVPFMVFAPVRDADKRIVDFRFVYLNAAAANVMRIRASDFAGRKVLDVLPRAWDDPGRFEMYVEALERNEMRQAERQSAADGNHAWYHIVASPLDGDLAIWWADITQRKRYERELLDADRRKDEFLATLAHELRNPLAPIRQAATIARNENATEAQKRWSNNVIERQVQHMSLLLDDLLDVSRITHGTLQLRKQRSDLQSIVGAAVETARPLIDERRHQLALDIPEHLHVNSDPLRLAQVLSNLLTNAAKYTNPQGKIRVVATQKSAELEMLVEDNGIGIAPEDLPKVFGMFAQLRAAQDHAGGGLGIGLALAKGIVELHGGRIEAASAGVGMGSRFTVRLPNAAVAAVDAPVIGAARNGHAAPNKRILLADDNRDAAESLAIILRLEGHEVELAHDGNAALRSYEERRPDVALLDIGMPMANGYEVARRIRAMPAGKEVLLIAITGWAQDADKAESRAAGFDHHLTKPIEPDALIDLLGAP